VTYGLRELRDKTNFRRSNRSICARLLRLGLLTAATRTLLTAAICVLLIAVGGGLAQETKSESWKFQAMNRAQSVKAGARKEAISSAEREEISAISRSASASAGQINTPLVHVFSAGATSLVLNVEFTSEAARLNFALPGATVFAAAGPFAEMFVKPTDEVIEALVNVPGIRRIEPESPIKLPPPLVLPAGVASRGLSEQVVSGGISGLTGKGVIFAILDSGLDFRNADFVDSSGPLPRSRLLYFWDTLSDAFESKGLGIRPPVDYPNGRPIGTLYTRAQLTADLRLPVAQRKIPSPDENGHGTAAASIAVGNGRNSAADDQHIGVAPDADIIAVRIGDAQGTMPEGFLLNAIVAWLDKAAGEAREPVVISCSFGGHFTGHDGASVEERHLSARFAPELVGRAIVIAAGNEREDAVHAKVKIGGKASPGVLAWKARDGAVLKIYLRPASAASFRPEDLNYDAIKLFGPDPLGSGAEVPHPTQLKKVSDAAFNPITGEWVLSVTVGRGPGGMQLYATSGLPVDADAYFVDAPATGTFMEKISTPTGLANIAFHGEQISSPGTAANAITVGSYDWTDQFDGQAKTSCGAPINIGTLSCYSNPGYNRAPIMASGAAVVKPEITAPGQVFTASYARLTDGRALNEVLPKTRGEPYWQVDHSGRYVLFDGTSASAPYVAGIVALMMQKKPSITAGEIKNVLRRHASSDAETTGAVPNPSWGYGKLDLKAVKAALNDVK
jgi:subtilisin family serine protease